MIDSSGNGRDGTYYSGGLGAAGLLTGDANTAVSRAGGLVAYTPSGAWMNASAFSVEALFSPTQMATQVIMSRHDAFNVRSFEITTVADGTLYCYFWTDVNTSITAIAPAGTIQLNTTAHIVLTYGPDNGGLLVYVNGVLVATTAAGTVAITPGGSNFTLGGYGAAANAQIYGILDEVALYGTRLPAARIAAHYTAVTQVVPASASASGSLALGGSGAGPTGPSGAGSLALSGSGVGAGSTSATAYPTATSYEITSGNDTSGRDPKTWTLEGSNDGGSLWTVLDTRTDEPLWPSRNFTRAYTIASPGSYQRLRWNITVNHGAPEIQASELRFITAGATTVVVDGAAATSGPGLSPSFESPSKLFDGDTNLTKWLIFSTASIVTVPVAAVSVLSSGSISLSGSGTASTLPAGPSGTGFLSLGAGAASAPVVVSGAGAISLGGAGAPTSDETAASGAGSLSLVGGGVVESSGSGSLALVAVGTAETPPPAYLLLFAPAVVAQPPATITVAMSNLLPLSVVEFRIDGVLVGTAVADVQGDIDAMDLLVDRQFAAGTHTVVGTSTTDAQQSASATFAVTTSAASLPALSAADVAASLVPDAALGGGHYKWVFQDPKPGGLGSWVMPIGPSGMTSPHVRKTVAASSTVTAHGRPHVSEGARPVEWEFSGFCPDEAFQDQLIAFSELPRRFYVIDHRNRAWVIAIAALDIRPRRRVIDDAGQNQDWYADYTIKAALFSQTPSTL